MKVQVLMSSYNGAKYIHNQINSILNQKNVQVSLLIRDDGSTDLTKDIIRTFNRPEISCVFEKNIGAKKSFLKLIKMADPNVDYYAFADQDDVWLDDKLSTAVDILENAGHGIPLIYGSPVSLYSDGKVIGTQFECPPLSLGNFLVKNYYPGCTMVFNKQLVDLINIADYQSLNPQPLHDHWLNLVCTACGGRVIIDSKPHILYRLHGDNVVGDRGFLQKIKENGLLTRSENTRYKICEELYENYGSYVDANSSLLIKTILDYPMSIKNRFKLANNKAIKPFSTQEKVAIGLIALMGKF